MPVREEQGEKPPPAGTVSVVHTHPYHIGDSHQCGSSSFLYLGTPSLDDTALLERYHLARGYFFGLRRNWQIRAQWGRACRPRRAVWILTPGIGERGNDNSDHIITRAGASVRHAAARTAGVSGVVPGPTSGDGTAHFVDPGETRPGGNPGAIQPGRRGGCRRPPRFDDPRRSGDLCASLDGGPIESAASRRCRAGFVLPGRRCFLRLDHPASADGPYPHW
jgi:hypothetical protein